MSLEGSESESGEMIFDTSEMGSEVSERVFVVTVLVTPEIVSETILVAPSRVFVGERMLPMVGAVLGTAMVTPFVRNRSMKLNYEETDDGR